MTKYLLILVSAFIFAAGATPLFRRIAPRWGIVDKPRAAKSTPAHTTMGGVAIYLAFIVALLVLGDRFYIREVAGILLGATLARSWGCGMIASD
jgi:UDP-N-acetylmuramyl pentapeptide phosphotransferase/UDP-N-acetylglucosamine-1-phosphate transferase